MLVARFDAPRLDALERRAAARPLFAGLALLVTAWLALLWPAAMNGQPFLFHDTTAYIRGAAFPAEKFGGLKTVWSEAAAAPAAAQKAPSVIAKSASSVEDKTVFAGRSIYYGSLLFWGFVVGGMWLPVLLQAAIVLAAVFCALRLLVSRPMTSTALTLVALGLATPLSWFSGYMMPDLFAGLGVLSTALLLTHIDKMQRWERVFWFVLLTFALAAHTSHLVTASALIGIAVVAKFLLRRDLRASGFALIAGAIGAALMADAAFSVAVTRVTGAAPVRPPMLTARVMHSETGRAYLKTVCPAAGYAVCAFVDRPAMTANDFLWSPDPAIGVFTQADPVTRRALSEEQMRVFLSAFFADPVASTRELLTRWGMLLAVTDIPEFNHAAADRAYFAAKLPPLIHATFAATPSAQGMLPTGMFQMAFLLTMFGGTAVSILLLRGETGRINDMALILLAGVLINAAICSGLSGVEPRYQTRMIWLLPFLAMTLGWRRLAQTASTSTRIPLPTTAAA